MPHVNEKRPPHRNISESVTKELNHLAISSYTWVSECQRAWLNRMETQSLGMASDAHFLALLWGCFPEYRVEARTSKILSSFEFQAEAQRPQPRVKAQAFRSAKNAL